ncbi:hypothetical protein HMPREF9103_02952 [Lentilactobacillus parafarraginis F0439]|uniref:Uncharacterized protein n=1 Tax=Lentilactobacillus parafarraginis F0439 TaxID=797515 RepID=G9ZT80_9LACO|nr:hypothetical protein [Lentilactobacillus parafarraginis]EHL95465.1 hypothetical protein HMPREF9103_02952 [Lentilactobacillus parafarraginis F0439]
MTKEIVAVPTEKIQQTPLPSATLACRITSPEKLEVEIYNHIEPALLKMVLEGLKVHD